ncbi:MAG: GTP--adenosylcobinamide-phosphate guanylyltransferase, partial [Pseudomonadota bacterium]
AGPAASALAGARAAGEWPLLLTTADHALLRPALVNDFCAQAAHLRDADLVVGLVPAERVRARFPGSRRTWLKFRDGACCGSNLFYLAKPRAQSALAFWQQLEALRKQPWRMAKQLGPSVLARYLAGRLTLDDALTSIGERCDARLRAVRLDEPLLAVDVDSPADHRLAGEILRERHDGPA